MSSLSPSSLPIVGAHFRPPAKALLAALRSSFPLELRPEPHNPYDANAVGVWMDALNLNNDEASELDGTLQDMGSDLDDILEQRFWHLGYIPRAEAEGLHERIALAIEQHNVNAAPTNDDFPWQGLPGTLSFTPEGHYAISFHI